MIYKKLSEIDIDYGEYYMGIIYGCYDFKNPSAFEIDNYVPGICYFYVNKLKQKNGNEIELLYIKNFVCSFKSILPKKIKKILLENDRLDEKLCNKFTIIELNESIKDSIKCVGIMRHETIMDRRWKDLSVVIPPINKRIIMTDESSVYIASIENIADFGEVVKNINEYADEYVKEENKVDGILYENIPEHLSLSIRIHKNDIDSSVIELPSHRVKSYKWCYFDGDFVDE